MSTMYIMVIDLVVRRDHRRLGFNTILGYSLIRGIELHNVAIQAKECALDRNELQVKACPETRNRLGDCPTLAVAYAGKIV